MKIFYTLILFAFYFINANAQYSDNGESLSERDSIDKSKPPYYLTCAVISGDEYGSGTTLTYRFCNNTNDDILNYSVVFYTYDGWDKPVAGVGGSNRSELNSQNCLIVARSHDSYPCTKQIMFPESNNISKIKMVITKVKYKNGKVIVVPKDKKYTFWAKAGVENDCDAD